MLVLRRRVGEVLLIGDNIEIEFLELSAHSAKVGIRAPKEVIILRKELEVAAAPKELPPLMEPLKPKKFCLKPKI